MHAYSRVAAAAMSQGADDSLGMGGKAPKKMGRIQEGHRREMEAWLKEDRKYLGGKEGPKMMNMRWCLGGGAKVSGGGMKDAKEVKSEGGFVAMAKHINAKCKLTGDQKWTGNIAKVRFENIMKSFRKVVKIFQLPKESDFGSNKNEFATAIQECHDKRHKGCSSYTAFWKCLSENPKYNGQGKTESAPPRKEGDDESDVFESSDNGKGNGGSTDDEGPPKGFAFSADARGKGTAGKDADANDDGSNHDDEDSEGDKGNRSPKCSTPAKRQDKSSKRNEDSDGGSDSETGASSKQSTPKRRGARAKAGKGTSDKRKKFSLKKPDTVLKHGDITRAYMQAKEHQNTCFVAISLLRERRATFFDCLERGMTSHDEIRGVFNTIGLGQVPDFMKYCVPQAAGGAANAEADDAPGDENV